MGQRSEHVFKDHRFTQRSYKGFTSKIGQRIGLLNPDWVAYRKIYVTALCKSLLFKSNGGLINGYFFCLFM